MLDLGRKRAIVLLLILILQLGFVEGSDVRRHSCFKALSSGLEEVLDDLGALDVSVLPHQALREETQAGDRPPLVSLSLINMSTQGVGEGCLWWRGAVMSDASSKRGSPPNTCISCAVFIFERMMLAGRKASDLYVPDTESLAAACKQHQGRRFQLALPGP
jgi:hypothetical protein